MDLNFDLYMNDVVNQARSEIEQAGYQQLTTAEAVSYTHLRAHET